MAMIDVQTPYIAAGTVSAQLGGAPTGGGNRYAAAAGPQMAPGTHGLGGNGQITHWVIGFYLFIGIVLVSAGVIFNGKG